MNLSAVSSKSAVNIGSVHNVSLFKLLSGLFHFYFPFTNNETYTQCECVCGEAFAKAYCTKIIKMSLDDMFKYIPKFMKCKRNN